jgi:hypothetical protein
MQIQTGSQSQQRKSAGLLDQAQSGYGQWYWGYAKYCYHKIPKTTFEEAKRAASKALDLCNVITICKFINQSFCFMSAYQKGLTGKAAEWAVKKQLSHRTVSKSACINIESLLN